MCVTISVAMMVFEESAPVGDEAACKWFDLIQKFLFVILRAKPAAMLL